nr:hypothetical protein [Tanacetum cinerariifolium]
DWLEKLHHLFLETEDESQDTVGFEFGQNWKNRFERLSVDTEKFLGILYSYHNKENLYPEIHLPSPKTSDEVFQANHSIQNKESFENPFDEIAVSSSNLEEPPHDSDIRQLIREECCTEISEEQKQGMEDTMLELVKIYQEKEFLCIHDDVDDLIESALNSKLLLINSNSQRLDKKEQEVKNFVEQPVERGNHNIQSL